MFNNKHWRLSSESRASAQNGGFADRAVFITLNVGPSSLAIA